MTDREQASDRQEAGTPNGVPTLEYRAEKKPSMSWWFAPLFVIPATAASAYALMGSSITSDGVAKLLAAPVLVLLVLSRQVPLHFSIFIPFIPLTVVQFTVYFAVIRRRRAEPMVVAAAFHVVCVVIAEVLIPYLI